mmetsp:Transcript_31250/g.76546  ORF Transcript_31250/g.76546 Transcript_31250/m.76546 type:complete len:207 (+) Transcript_31250:376-996(+)
MRRARRPAATKTTKRKKRNTFITLRPKSTPLHPHPRQPRNTQRNKKRRRMKCKSCTIVVVTRDHLQKQLQRPRTRLRSHRHRAPQPHAHTTQAPHPRPTPTRTTKTSTASPTNHTATSSDRIRRPHYATDRGPPHHPRLHGRRLSRPFAGAHRLPRTFKNHSPSDSSARADIYVYICCMGSVHPAYRRGYNGVRGTGRVHGGGYAE